MQGEHKKSPGIEESRKEKRQNPKFGIQNRNAIEVVGLTKQFRQQHTKSMKRVMLGLFDRSKVEEETFTALSDISFVVPRGQTVAVIGRNGSGKSTLLGLLARVYRPTEGTIALRGMGGGEARLAPLLELGAGFHPDLTGYENVEFYGAVLGLTQDEVQSRLPEIIAFAELGRKMETVLHQWNDGAKLRLGFAIATHIDPDILLVDEVLAVGDEAFQNKCYRLIAEMQAQGKTILFVSHDLAAVERVADRVLWMKSGEIFRDGNAAEVLAEYRADAEKQI